jgi:amino-acid N-acetyltransferase
MIAEITKPSPEDLNDVLALLADASLPRDGVAKHFKDFLVARADGKVVGAVGMEHYGSSALLRSLVVAPSHRNRGWGRALTEQTLQEAKERGAKRVYLLTETASEFFPRFGFKQISREEADAEVKGSVEFKTACCQSAVCMRLDL